MIFLSSPNDVLGKLPYPFKGAAAAGKSGLLPGSGVGLSSGQGAACVLPELVLWHPELTVYRKDPKPLRCSEAESNWVYTANGTFRISRDAIEKHGSIMCIYVPILRGKNDFEVSRGNPIKPMVDGARLTSDVFEAKCVGSDGAVRTNVYVGVSPKEDILSQRKVAAEQKQLQEQHSSGSSLDLDILMFGFDSVSRLTWMRNLPNSYRYFVEILGGTVLEGYNIVGDGTPQALLPLLTGKTEQELPEARRGFSGATTVDGHPWIWKDLKKLGYVTQWGEDGSNIGTFTYRMLGFKHQPVDHYLRTFYLAADKDFRKYQPNCLGSLPRHLNMMNWLRDFVAVYSQRRKFSFVFHSEYSHDGYTDLKNADGDLRNLLEHLNRSGALDRAMLVLMSDHGARFQNVRNTEQGKYEERMPFFGVRFPAWFAARHPDAAANLETNSRRLVTAFDVHATFHDLIDYFAAGDDGGRAERGISLFREIPKERSCADAGIEPHWCSCLSWTAIDSEDDTVHQAALALVRAINGFTDSERADCEELQLAEVSRAVKWVANDQLLRFRQSADRHGRVPDLSDRMNSTEALFQMTVRTVPGNALYEGTVKFAVGTKVFTASEREISRINKYGDQPHCVMSRLPHLRAYCYCRRQLSSQHTEGVPL